MRVHYVVKGKCIEKMKCLFSNIGIAILFALKHVYVVASLLNLSCKFESLIPVFVNVLGSSASSWSSCLRENSYEEV